MSDFSDVKFPAYISTTDVPSPWVCKPMWQFWYYHIKPVWEVWPSPKDLRRLWFHRGPIRSEICDYEY